MTFGEVATSDAAGAVLAHSVVVGTVRWSKGRLIGSADVATALAAGVARLTVARLDAGDVAENEAAAVLAARLAGPNVSAAAAAHGRANLIAAAAGLVRLDAAAVDAANAVDESLTIGTLAPLTRVAAGDVVATVKIIPYAVPRATLAVAAAAAAPIGVTAFAPRRFVLIQTRVAGTTDKVLARTDAVTRDRIARLGGSLAPWVACAHDAVALAAVIAAVDADAIVLIAGASATVDRRDVVPAAIVAAGGTVERLGMPVDPGNLLCLGSHAGRAVVGLPGCARSPKRNGFDWVLERLAAGIAVDGRDIAAMGVGGLLPEAERPQPRVVTGGSAATAVGDARSTVGAIVLAAGRSTRMGSVNKLLADLDGRPVVAHAVAAVAAAGLAGPVVVLGHMADAVRTAIGAETPGDGGGGGGAHAGATRFVIAADFNGGMSRSLAAGLAAAPPDWCGALIVLGDMPRVAPTTLAAIAAAVTDTDAVVVPLADGKRGNPVAWGRAHWARLTTLTGDAGGRALLAEVATIEVETGDPGILADVDTPAALALLRG